MGTNKQKYSKGVALPTAKVCWGPLFPRNGSVCLSGISFIFQRSGLKWVISFPSTSTSSTFSSNHSFCSSVSSSSLSVASSELPPWTPFSSSTDLFFFFASLMALSVGLFFGFEAHFGVAEFSVAAIFTSESSPVTFFGVSSDGPHSFKYILSLSFAILEAGASDNIASSAFLAPFITCSAFRWWYRRGTSSE